MGNKRGALPRYWSGTRDGFIKVGPGAGSHLAGSFALNTFDLKGWINAVGQGRTVIALRMPFAGQMPCWWWLYWRYYDTRIPLDELDATLGEDASKARRWLRAIEPAGLAVRIGGWLVLVESGAFRLHMAQNQLALDYVNALWAIARRSPWPQAFAT